MVNVTGGLLLYNLLLFALHQLEEFVGGADLFRDGDGDAGALLGLGDGTVVVVDLIGCDVDDTSGGTRDEHLVAYTESIGLDGELSDAEFRVILRALADVDLALGGIRAIALVPFTHQLSLIVTIPETTIEDGGKTLVPLILALLSKRSVEHGLDGLLVTLHDGIDVFRPTGSSLDLKDADASLHHTIDETDGLQVLGRHDILVVDVELIARFIVGSGVRTAAHLNALPTIG